MSPGGSNPPAWPRAIPQASTGLTLDRVRDMPICLTNEFIAIAQRDPFSVAFGDRTLVLRATNASSGMVAAELEIVDGGDVIGYVTPYGDNERGVVQSASFGQVAPRIYRSLDDALRAEFPS